MRLKGEIVLIRELSSDQIERMYELLLLHYENVNSKIFLHDLGEKEWVILLTDSATGLVQGFSTMKLLDQIVDGVPVKALFSGDTIVSKDYWGEPTLAHLWGRFAMELIKKHQGTKLYWFLISKGYRTYHFLSLYFYEFYPRHNKSFPPFEKKVLDSLAFSKYGDLYDPRTQVIRLHEAGNYYLKPGIADIDGQKMHNPDIGFFARINPLHTKGDELACLAELSLGNFKPIALRIISRGESKK